MTKERQMELFISLSKDCMRREGASEDDLAAMMAGQASSSHGAKCIQACLGERTALVSKALVGFIQNVLCNPK